MMTRLLDNLVLFGRTLREAGLAVGAAQIATLTEALAHVEISRRREFKDVARAVLVGRRSEIELFDRLFDLFWRPELRRDTPEQPFPAFARPLSRRTVAVSEDPGRGEAEADETASGEAALLLYSRDEILRRKDFAEATPEERAEIARLLDAFRLRVARRRTRRRVASCRGSRLDLRRTLRRSLRFGGEPLRLARRRRKEKERPLVVLCDVSASMEVYTRLLLRFLHAAGRGSRRYEAFLFGTRLTRVTRQLRTRDVDRALGDCAATVRDWGGGTRIGEALKAFNYDWGRRVLGQGAIVMLISDGWDRGDVALMEREMARLRRTCERLIWLNPLLGSPDYRPLTRGMRAALPHVDDFLPVHNLASLEQLANTLGRLDRSRLRSYGAAATRRSEAQAPSHA